MRGIYYYLYSIVGSHSGGSTNEGKSLKGEALCVAREEAQVLRKEGEKEK